MNDEFGPFDRFTTATLRPLRRWPYGPYLAQLGSLMIAVVVPLLVRFAGVSTLPFPVVVLLVVLSFLPFIVMSAVLMRAGQIVKKFHAAYARRDIPEITRMKRLMEGSGPPANDQDRANRLLGEAELLLTFERWAEARDAYSRIDVSKLPPRAAPILGSARALATAHAGQGDLAVPMVEQALHLADTIADYPPGKRWVVHARLGVVLSLAGRHDDAVAVIEALLDDPSTEQAEVDEWTAALFFLGTSSRAAGAVDDALACFERAATEGEGPFVARAQAVLDRARAAPLRDGGGPRVVTASDRGAEDGGESADVVAEKLRRAMRR